MEIQRLEKVRLDGTRLGGQLLCIQICLDENIRHSSMPVKGVKEGRRQWMQNALKERGNLFQTDRLSRLHCNHQDVPLQFLIIELIPLRPPPKVNERTLIIHIHLITSSPVNRERGEGEGALSVFLKVI